MYNTEGVDRDLPQFIFGERHYILFLYSRIVEQDVPLNNFLCQGPPHPSSPPGAQVMGESSHCPRPTGTIVLK